MTNEERDIITQFITRVSGAQRTPQPALGGSVPATTQPPLPPVDRDADALIGALFQQYPEARYRLTQTATHNFAVGQFWFTRVVRIEHKIPFGDERAFPAVAHTPVHEEGAFVL